MTRGPVVERASPVDMMELASDVGPAPRQVGALLRFAAGSALDLADVRAALADRIGGIRRLRQKLVPAPWGCGRPVWADDPDFGIDRHVRAVACGAPADDTALLAVAAGLVTRKLPAHRPLWEATLVGGLADGGAALVVVFHHVLADGMGGLAVLASLVDGGPYAPRAGSPAALPGWRALARDAAVSRLRALGRLDRVPGTIRAGLGELRSGSVPRAGRCSLNRPAGARRRLAVARADLARIRAVGHTHGGSVNDVMLSAIGGALGAVLAGRGEHVDPFVVSVPVSGRSQATAGALGNQVGVMPVAVPGRGDVAARLAAVAAATRAHQADARGASVAILAPASRVLAGLHLLRWVVNHQHLVHTFATNLRGPQDRVSFLGQAVSDIVPLSVLAGNVAVAFAVMSYAGSVTVTITVDPDVVPDLDVLAAALRRELRDLEQLGTAGSPLPGTDSKAEPTGARRLAMADTGPEDVEKRALLAFLEAQRAIVAGLAEDTDRASAARTGSPQHQPLSRPPSAWRMIQGAAHPLHPGPGSRREAGDNSGRSRSSSPMPGESRAAPASRSAT